MSNCGQTPIYKWTLSIWFFIEYPPTNADPLVGEKMPVIIDSKVVFPAPLGPKRPKIVLSYTIKFRLLTANFPVSYFFVRPLQIKGYNDKSSTYLILIHS